MTAVASKILSVASLRLRGKILFVFGIVAFLLLAAAAVGLWQFDVSLRAFEEVGLDQNRAVNVQATEAAFKKQVQEWKDMLLRGKKPEALDKYWTNFQQRESEVRGLAEHLSRDISDPETKQLVAQFVAAHKSMGDGYRRGLQAFKDHQFDSAAGDAAVAGVDRAPTELLTKAKDRLVSRASARAAEAKDSAYSAMRASIVLLAAMTAIGVVVFLVVIQKSVSGPLVRLTGGMRHLAGGNFDVVLPGLGRKDEIGDIAGAVEEFKVKAAEKAQHEAE